jgi:hypothetical protein
MGDIPAEDDLEVNLCPTDERHLQMLQNDPLYKNARTLFASISSNTSAGRSITEHIRIPVVFHILHHTKEQEISTEQVDSQIDALNRDFNLLNRDIDSVPSVWKDRVGNPKITFFRTRRGPRGEATDGIVRKFTPCEGFPGSASDAMKFDSTGGSNIWDRDRFLNIWVCDLKTLLGFAQFPAIGAAKETDGVVINYEYFGQIGTARSPFNLGRTAVHEIGHWLDLRHIWAEDSDIPDTPRCDNRNFGKPFFPKLSLKVSNGLNGDIFMNYISIPISKKHDSHFLYPEIFASTFADHASVIL